MQKGKKIDFNKKVIVKRGAVTQAGDETSVKKGKTGRIKETRGPRKKKRGAENRKKVFERAETMSVKKTPSVQTWGNSLNQRRGGGCDGGLRKLVGQKKGYVQTTK